ncbi:MAG: NYN domain-containing protein [Patescibacteria group bacterium]
MQIPLSQKMPPVPKTIVYIDGFNVYYNLVRNTNHKWLNLRELLEYVFPKTHNDIVSIKYFTALIKTRRKDPDQLIRQQTYIRALETIQGLEVIYGSFLTNPVFMPLVMCERCVTLGPIMQVLKTEEKGSDVNLATHLIKDGCQGNFDVAIVITNDSDFALPIGMVRDEFKKTIIVGYPTPKVSGRLSSAATFVRRIRRGNLLMKFQFPQTLTDKIGTITKPATW